MANLCRKKSWFILESRFKILQQACQEAEIVGFFNVISPVFLKMSISANPVPPENFNLVKDTSSFHELKTNRKCFH